MSPRRVILVFVKWPAPGRVKTRLAADAGAAEAASIYRLLVERVASTLRNVPADEIRICFDPAERESEIRDWLEPLFAIPGSVTFQTQESGDLGERLQAAFETAFETENTIVAAIGTDCIEIDAATFEKTWSALESRDTDAVFGPARDGGYYLVGLNSLQPDLFAGIPWSTAETLPATLRKARAARLRFILLAEKRDIDTFADWKETADSPRNP